MNISGFALTAVMFFEGSLWPDEKMMITGIAALVVLIDSPVAFVQSYRGKTRCGFQRRRFSRPKVGDRDWIIQH
jgi:hypothetical protein